MTDEQVLGTFLSTRDVPCPSCGYNLRGINSPVCPECAEPLALRVGFARDTTRALLAAILPPAVVGGAGLCLVSCFLIVSLFMSSAVLSHAATGEGVAYLWAPFGIGIALMGYTWLLARLRGRVWFRRLSASRRRLVVASSVLLAASGFVLWAAIVVVFTF